MIKNIFLLWWHSINLARVCRVYPFKGTDGQFISGKSNVLGCSFCIQLSIFQEIFISKSIWMIANKITFPSGLCYCSVHLTGCLHESRRRRRRREEVLVFICPIIEIIRGVCMTFPPPLHWLIQNLWWVIIDRYFSPSSTHWLWLMQHNDIPWWLSCCFL